MDCKSSMKNEEIPENNEIFVYGFKHVKTDKLDIYLLIGSESVDLYENNKLFNFWSNKFINKEIKMRNFIITGGSFMTLVKKTFLKSRALIVVKCDVELIVIFSCCLLRKLFN